MSTKTYAPSPVERRGYQEEAVEAAFRDWSEGEQRIVIVMPTGTGKTVVASMISVKARDEHKLKVLFLVHRELLVHQAAKKLREFGLTVGIEMAEYDAYELEQASGGKFDVVVGTVQTLQGPRLTRWAQDRFDLIIVDECHRRAGMMHRATTAWFPKARELGITATLDGGDRGKLGRIYPKKSFEYPFVQAVDEGAIAEPTRHLCSTGIDLRDIKTTGGDFDVRDIAERVAPKIEEIADGIIQAIGTRYTVVFVPDVLCAKFMAQMLVLKGMAARHVCGAGGDHGMPKKERKEILQSFKDKEFQAIVCCDLLIEGWDMPHVSCAVIARPTKRRYRYVQMVGRATRINKGVEHEDCLILDLDWQTDETSKDLCTEIALFDDGTVDPEVVKFVRERIKDGERDIRKAIADGNANLQIKRKLMLHMTGRKAAFKTRIDKPAGIAKLIDVKFKSKYDMDYKGTNPASAAQVWKLNELGVKATTGLSKWGASKLIDRLVKRNGLSTVDQIKELVDRGMQPDLARGLERNEADKALAIIQQMLF